VRAIQLSNRPRRETNARERSWQIQERSEQQGAAGSLYYEAPAVLRFGQAMPERGSLVLRLVNDVDGATPEQLRWHIERSTIGAGQQ
jgi:hypothetical protein